MKIENISKFILQNVEYFEAVTKIIIWYLVFLYIIVNVRHAFILLSFERQDLSEKVLAKRSIYCRIPFLNGANVTSIGK